MAPVDGRNEVPDSEDEPMTSSPVAVSDGTADKLFAIAHVPPQDTQDAPREVARLHQATTGTVANVTAQRTDGLDADQSIASIDVDAPMDEGTDIQPITTATPSKPTDKGSNNAANDLLPHVATQLSPGIGDTRPRQHATMAHFTQNKQLVPAGAKTAGPETKTAPTAQQTSAVAEDPLRDEVTGSEQQPQTVDNNFAPECANEQCSYQSSNEPQNINKPEGESVPQHVEADLPQYVSNDDDEVSKVRSNEQSALEEANTLVTSQHDTSLLPASLLSTDRTTSIESKDAQHVNETTRPMQQDVIQRLKGEVSSRGSGTKHGAISTDVHDTNDVAAGLHTGSQGQSKGLGGGKETQQDASMSPNFSSGAHVESHGGTITPNDDSKRDEADGSSTSMDTEPQDSAAASVSCGLDSKMPSFNTPMDVDISPSDSKAENHTSIKEAAASPSLSTLESTDVPTAHNSAEQTSQDPSDNHLEMSNVPVATNVCKTAKAVPDDNTPTSEATPNQKRSAQPEPPQACLTPTPARTPQEITLAELKAQKSAMLASLAALPAIQVLMEENASADVKMAEADEEPTEADIMTAANKIVKDHIKLLHEYNELKDVGQGLMGLIADQRGVRIIEVQEEFGIEAQD